MDDRLMWKQLPYILLKQSMAKLRRIGMYWGLNLNWTHRECELTWYMKSSFKHLILTRRTPTFETAVLTSHSGMNHEDFSLPLPFWGCFHDKREGWHTYKNSLHPALLKQVWNYVSPITLNPSHLIQTQPSVHYVASLMVFPLQSHGRHTYSWNDY